MAKLLLKTHLVLLGLSFVAPLSARAAAVEGPFDLRAAIGLALTANPDVALARAAQLQGEAVSISSNAAFDTVATASLGSSRDKRPLRSDERARYGSAGPDQQQDQDNASLGASRLLESGHQLGATYAVARSTDNLLGAQNIGRQNTDRLTFTLRVPLGKNAGMEAAAGRDAARLDASATNQETVQALARSVLAVTSAYWDWTARLQSQAVANGSLSRIEQLKRETEKLIEQDELPPAELNLLDAAVNERATAAIGAEQKSADGRYQLARLFGMDNAQANALPAPAAVLPSSAGEAATLAALGARALELRADLAALRLREQAMEARLQAARENNKSNLDLDLSAYAAGLREAGRATPTAIEQTERSTGPGVAAKLSWQWPVSNSANRGAVQAAQANAETARIRRRALESTILTSVEAAYRAHAAVAAQLRSSGATVERYRAALKDSQSKRLLGSATLIDVLNVEDRLNNAILARVQYQQAYATARAQLLFECGALLQVAGDGTVSVDMARLQPE